MMKLKRIISLALTLAICMSSAAFAATIDEVLDNDFKTQVDYAADIYKYDMDLIGGKTEEVEEEEEIPVEILKHERAAKIMSALGLMSFRDDGFFYEDEILKVNDFCKIVDAIIGMSDEYQTKTNITHKDILDVIIKALGYDYMSEKSIMEKVYRENILDGITYNAEKFATRGDAARLFYNALKTPVMEIASVGNNVSYISSEDNTLLTYVFGLEEIEGLVTGANGVSVYSNKELNKGYIEINRGTFYLDAAVDTTSLLGKKVYGLFDENNEEKILFLAEDVVKQSVVVPFDKIKQNGDVLSWEIDGVKGKANTSSIKNISFNGTAYMGSDMLSEIKSGEGTVLFAASSGSTYDIAVINKYETLVVEKVSARDQKIYFADGRTFNEKSYIDLSEKVNPYICATLNGKTVNPIDFQPGTIISVVANGRGYYRIDASDKYVKGEITEIAGTDSSLGDAYFIKDKYYLVSTGYQKSIDKGAKLPQLELGLSNIYALNALGHISYAGTVADDKAGTVQSTFKYAFLKTIVIEDGFEESAAIRVFTQDGSWNNYNIAKKVVIDGIEKTTFADISSTLTTIQKQVEGTLIRYKLNNKREISFIDTKIMNDEEKNDTDAISLTDEAIDHEVTIEWNKGATFLQKKYGILSDTLIFYQPSDADDESSYSIMKQKDLKTGKATFNFYNVDDFYYASLALYQGKLKPSFPTNDRYFVITSVMNAVNEKGENVYRIKGLDAVSTDEDWVYREYETSTRVFNRTDYRTKNDVDYVPKVGDFVQCSVDGNGKVNGFNPIAVADEMLVDGRDYYMHYYYNYPSQNDYAIGEVMKVDSKRNLVLFRTFNSIETAAPATKVEIGTNANTDTYSAIVDRVVIFDEETKTAEIASVNDLVVANDELLEPGDRIAMFGGWGYVGAVVYRPTTK